MARSDRDAPEQDGFLPATTEPEVPAEETQAWEQIENGRYMPRRIRGSYRGRVLG